jgi:hypothetical protein
MTYGPENQFCPYTTILPQSPPPLTATKTTTEYINRFVPYSILRQTEQDRIQGSLGLAPQLIVTSYESMFNALALSLAGESQFVTPEERATLWRAYERFKNSYVASDITDFVFLRRLLACGASYTTALQAYVGVSNAIVDGPWYFASDFMQLRNLFIEVWNQLPDKLFDNGIPRRRNREIEAFARSTEISITEDLIVGGRFGAGLGLFVQYQVERILAGRNGPCILFDPERSGNFATPATLKLSTANSEASSLTAVVPLPPYEIMSILSN